MAKFADIFVSDLANIIITKYPGKISFLAGILRRFDFYGDLIWNRNTVDTKYLIDSVIFKLLPFQGKDNELCDWSQNILKNPIYVKKNDVAVAYLIYRLMRYKLNLS